MNHTTNQPVFLTLVRSPGELPLARVLIDSIRSFGGPLSQCPIWLFEANPGQAPCASLEGAGVRVLSLTVPATVRHHFFGDKVYACARAEELAGDSVRSLVWIDPMCLMVNPPLLFDLGQGFDAAVRPVHIRNVGLLADEPVDAFWRRVYDAVGVPDVLTTVESFVDAQCLRAYFNSHAFAVNPARGLLGRWFQLFESLVGDREFQAGPGRDERHHIFLFQAVLSALLVTALDPGRICMLPPNYNYPYNLHQSVPPDRRARALDDLVCVAYEDRAIDPALMDDIEVREPLRSWLSAHTENEPN